MMALVGGDTLLARDLRELLGDVVPSPRVQLISATADGSAVLDPEEEVGAVLMLPLAAESLEGAKVAFLAGSPASSRRTLKLNPAADGPVLIDLTAALEEQPNARLRAPTAEPKLEAHQAGSIHVIANPAAIALTMLLAGLTDAAPIRRSLVHVFEPASERGQKGLDELHGQTTAVLAFKKLKKDVFDAQLAFNVLARYGEEALEPLELVEQRIERHLASLLSAYPSIPMPSLRLIQAPVFHGHSFSVWVEFEENPGVEALSKALAEAGFDMRPDEPPTNVGVAGQSGLSIGGIAVDPNQARACWLWMVADNLRLTAENALAVAKEYL
jgi:aspartate-semialdehyde dehydrogenase